MKQRTLNNQDGIALGPILFIIAILAVLAGAIAAGSGSFTANTNAESAKAMAEVVIQSCHAYQDAMNVVLGNGCDETKVDYTPDSGWPTGSTSVWQHGDYTGGNGTNRAGNGSCALFDPRGGGLHWQKLPAQALVPNPTGAYTQSSNPNVDAFAGYPILYGNTCIYNFGICQQIGVGGWFNYNGALILEYYYLNHDTCQQINKTLNTNVDPNSTSATICFTPYTNPSNLFANGGVTTNGNTAWAAGFQSTSKPHVTEGCAYDSYSDNGNSAYDYYCGFMIR
jgi:hypothetical protein